MFSMMSLRLDIFAPIQYSKWDPALTHHRVICGSFRYAKEGRERIQCWTDADHVIHSIHSSRSNLELI